MACFDLLRRKSRDYETLLNTIQGNGGASVLFLRACGAVDVHQMQDILELAPTMDVNTIGGVHSVSPLHILSSKNNAIAGIELLLRNGANVGVLDRKKRTPLLCASRQGRIENIIVLLNAGSNPNQSAKNGDTPLMAACRNGHEKAVKLLLDHGADPYLVTSDYHWNCLHYASCNSWDVCMSVLFEHERGFNVQNLCNQADVDGRTPLHVAARNGHTKCLRVLLNAGATATPDNNGLLPLHLAAADGQTRSINLLLESGSNPTLQTNEGLLPIQFAAHNGHKAATLVLLDVVPSHVDSILKYIKNVEFLSGVARHRSRIMSRMGKLVIEVTKDETLLLELVSCLPTIYISPDTIAKNIQDKFGIKIGPCVESVDLPSIQTRTGLMWAAVDPWWNLLEKLLVENPKKSPVLMRALFNLCEYSFCKDGLIWGVKVDWSDFSKHESNSDIKFNAIFEENNVLIRPPDQMVRLVKLLLSHSTTIQSIINDDSSLILGHLDFILRTDPLRSVINTTSVPFKEKEEWLRKRLLEKSPNDSEDWMSGSDIVDIDRSRIFSDSCGAVLSFSPSTLRGLRIQFNGEVGVGVGVRREWFTVLSEELFNPDNALFSPSEDNAFQPNPHSHVNPDHLNYFHFAGRLVGMSICQGDPIDVHFTRPFYNHILGIPIEFKDLAFVDAQYYKNLVWIMENQINDLGLDVSFCVETDWFGSHQVVELVPGGRDIPVTDSNKGDYVKLIAELRIGTAIQEQTMSFLSGLYSLVPPSLLCIFNAYELELLVAGLPEVNVDDWRANTQYTGGYSATHTTIQYFWDIVFEMDTQSCAMLLQFVTGSSRVPPGGFAALRSPTGPLLFTITRIDSDNVLPTASTCFNLLKLPDYSSREKMKSSLFKALQWGHRGFGFA